MHLDALQLEHAHLLGRCHELVEVPNPVRGVRVSLELDRADEAHRAASLAAEPADVVAVVEDHASGLPAIEDGVLLGGEVRALVEVVDEDTRHGSDDRAKLGPEGLVADRVHECLRVGLGLVDQAGVGACMAGGGHFRIASSNRHRHRHRHRDGDR